jgi:hypothetical protein
MQAKLSLIVMLGLLAVPAIARADSLSLWQIAEELKQDAVIPLAPSVGNQLAKNLLVAQAAAPYTAFKPDSLQLSIDATLKAIGLYVYPGGPSEIVSEELAPLPFLQSQIAIDDRLTVSLTPGSLDFGSQPVVTPDGGVDWTACSLRSRSNWARASCGGTNCNLASINSK